jgi:uncharacterized protein (TIGR02246 family)
MRLAFCWSLNRKLREGALSEKDEIEHLFAQYVAAVGAKDVDAFVALFDDDVRAFDMWGRWSYDGIDAWRGMAREWFGSLGDERVAVEFGEARITVGGELAIAEAFVTFKALSAAGEELRSLQNRLTWALRRDARGWKVLHEHTSAPLDDTAKAIFRR